MQQGNIFDTFVKDFFGMIFVIVDFLVNYGDPKFVSQIDLTKIQPAPTHYIGYDGRERIADLIFVCPLKNGNGAPDFLAVIVFEHQNQSLKYLPLKLLKYISAFWDAEIKAGKTVLSVPYFIVLRTGEKPFVGPHPQIADLVAKAVNGLPFGKMVEIEYDIVDLPTWNIEDLRGGAVLRFAIIILKTMTEGTEYELPKAFLALAELDDEELKFEFSRKGLILVDKAMKAHNRRLDEEMIHKALEPVFQEPERRENMIVSLFDEKFLAGKAAGKAEGKAEGMIAGKAEGIIAGKAEGKVETIFLFLADRFGGISKNLEKKVQEITDLEKLNELIKLSAKCESLEEFKKSLHHKSPPQASQ